MLRLTLRVEADVGRRLEGAGCGLLPQSIDDGGLGLDLRDSVMGRAAGCVSGLVFAPAAGLMVRFC